MKYYCIGIKGAGMSTLAQILYDLGNDVVGYDDEVNYKYTQKGLDERNIKIYNKDNLFDISSDYIVTYSMAFSEDHSEIKRVKDIGCQIKKYNEIMADVISLFKTIGVSGTHGKTTTSSIIKHILENTVGCNYFIGSGLGNVNKDNEYYVVESDEFNKHFAIYHPMYSIITNIEEEHMECYKDLDDIINTFEIFSNNTKDFVIANGDNESVRKIKFNKVYYYGQNDNNDYIIKDIKLESDGSYFKLYENKKLIDEFFIPLYGIHMVYNSVSAIIMCLKININISDIKKYLKTFSNAKRRFEEEFIKDTVIIDDYAHHPTEIKSTIEAVRQKYNDRKIVVVFRPNTYSRIKDFKDEFISSLKLADKVYLTEVLSNREKSEDYPNISSKSIGDNIDNVGYVEEDTINLLKDEINNVVVFMGCADNSHLIEGFKKLI